ncbi:LecA/PA-IL family lectin [Acidobacteria bacterium AH-259-D05]|nr:LecA/PA-IL family lectin [Acidobacteria bacterium AH-259-D05]
MPLKSKDMKKLWARSGNVCSFPGCDVELVLEKEASRVMGEEAHIKGEKKTAPRYDPSQTHDERESYENRILLCPNHHTEIDSDPEKWSVERLMEIKAQHEQRVRENWQFPKIMDELRAIVQQYQSTDERSELSIPEVIDDTRVIRVDASSENGVRAGIKVRAGQRIVFFARGLITYDGGHHFTSPEGIICNEYGLPFNFQASDGANGFAMWMHPNANQTDGDKPGRIGSLIGWINEYSEQSSFLIGSRRELEAGEDGELWLMVNDAKGTHGDNDGEFRVDIKLE